MSDSDRTDFLEKIEYELERLKNGMAGKKDDSEVKKQKDEVEKFTTPSLPKLQVDSGLKNILIFGSIVAILLCLSLYLRR